MAAVTSGLCKCLIGGNFERLLPFSARQSVTVNEQMRFLFMSNPSRSTHFFRHLAKGKEHNATDYEYEVSKDPKEWEYVERLLPYETVPSIKSKPVYSSGWRPATDEALQHPYYVERSKNHMLSVYLNHIPQQQILYTRVKRISGDIWKLHDELKAHIEETVGKKIPSYIQEGNNYVNFKGDHVYIVEQWLLSKGF